MNVMPADSSGTQSPSKYDRLIAAAKAVPPVPTIVVHPCDETSLRGVVDSAAAGIIRPVLVGPEQKIRDTASKYGLDISGFEIADAAHSEEAAAKGVELVHAAKGEMLMKGSLHTDELMRSVTAKVGGLRTDRRISHVFVMDVPSLPELVLVTDAAVNIAPTLEDKVDIVQNAIDLGIALGIAKPKVGVLSAVETVNPKIQSTLDAAVLSKMGERGQIRGGIIDGPLAMDNAVSLDAAETKGLTSLVAGRADILVVPNLEAGNILAKELTYAAQAEGAGLVLGAKVPVLLTSRADNQRSRLFSCAVAALYAHWQATGESAVKHA
jgi:phosphate acetyltransferase